MTTEPIGASDWLAGQRAAFESLAGRSISAWRGVEMALRDSSPSGPQFSDPQVPLLQLWGLEAQAGNDAPKWITTYQDDYGFGLKISESVMPSSRVWDGIYRSRPLDLPIGPVSHVQVRFEADLLSEVSLTVGGQALVLVAGEVYEDGDRLEVHSFDESVLVFKGLADLGSVRWVPPRV